MVIVAEPVAERSSVVTVEVHPEVVLEAMLVEVGHWSEETVASVEVAVRTLLVEQCCRLRTSVTVAPSLRWYWSRWVVLAMQCWPEEVVVKAMDWH